MRGVYIAGTGQTRFGKSEKSCRELMVEASIRAIEASGLEPRSIESSFYSNAFGFGERQIHIGPAVNADLGIPHCPSMTIESACASGATALHEAFAHIAAGLEDICLVTGGERVTHLDTRTATDYFAMGSDYQEEGAQGATFPSLYALMASAHMERYGTTEDMLAAVAIKNHRNALLNPDAHLKREITMSDYLESKTVASPLRLLDCCPFSDGAASVILVSEEIAKRMGGERVMVAASVRAGDAASLQSREELCSLGASRRAAREAFDITGLSPSDIDVAEVHDCFTIAEIMATEDMCFFERGKGGKAVMEGETERDGRHPVNVSGGLKAKGHPVGATGLSQIHELWLQLSGMAGKRQVEGADVGLAHNVGATGGSCTVHILRRTR
ncbi:MAG: thiolase domain-containing protein [Methanomassiliicoccales archaeon]